MEVLEQANRYIYRLYIFACSHDYCIYLGTLSFSDEFFFFFNFLQKNKNKTTTCFFGDQFHYTQVNFSVGVKIYAKKNPGVTLYMKSYTERGNIRFTSDHRSRLKLDYGRLVTLVINLTHTNTSLVMVLLNYQLP